MLSNYFKKQRPDKEALNAFFRQMSSNNQNYLEALHIQPREVITADLDELMENAIDVADRVTKVEKIFSKTYFNLFNSLLIKHDDRTIRLMFYKTTQEYTKVNDFFSILLELLGKGMTEGERFSSFHDKEKVKVLANGKISDTTDELIHLWSAEGFNVTLNYKIVPLRQLLFSISIKKERDEDTEQRDNGTLIPLLNRSLRVFDYNKAKSQTPFLEEGRIKFVDYKFDLDQPEFGIFDRINIRLFSAESEYSMETQTHVTYYSSSVAPLPAILDMVDDIIDIYGKDNYGEDKLLSHNIDDIRGQRYWVGKTWQLNNQHSPWDLSDESQQFLYDLQLAQDPEDLGLNLHISFFNKMEKYELGLI